ncbi:MULTISPECIES: PH domain-containing protein [Colwellia]|nr:MULTISPECIES: PH domain-containing protein [Colwellia]
MFLSKGDFAVHYTKITGDKIKDFNHMQGTAFTNTSLTAESLPSLVELEFQPISAIYRQSNLIINVAFTLFLVTLLFVIQQQNIWPLSNDVADLFNWLMLVLFMLGGFNTLYAAFADKQKFYALRQQDLSYRSGLLFRKTVSQPMLRIQHVELKRGPIDRKVGLAKLQVFSAGGAMHTFEIPGLPLASAESIRQFILDHKDVNRHG